MTTLSKPNEYLVSVGASKKRFDSTKFNWLINSRRCQNEHFIELNSSDVYVFSYEVFFISWFVLLRFASKNFCLIVNNYEHFDK